MTRTALIVGAGAGISASFAHRLARDGARVALAARDVAKLADLENKTCGLSITCDVSKPADIGRMFEKLDGELGVPDVVLYNPSARVRGAVTELDGDAVRNALMVTAMGAFLVAQQAARRMIERGSGAIFFTGASASIKGYANSSSFAMGKFALRGLAQSLARELGPKNIHVAHFIIDGAVRVPGHDFSQMGERAETPDAWLHPDAIAEIYLDVLHQHRSTWTHELDHRPWAEPF